MKSNKPVLFETPFFISFHNLKEGPVFQIRKILSPQETIQLAEILLREKEVIVTGPILIRNPVLFKAIVQREILK